MCIRDSGGPPGVEDDRGVGGRYFPPLEGALATGKERTPGFAAGARAFAQIIDFDDCLLYTSDAADERSSVDLGGRRIIKKKKHREKKKRANE